MPQASRQVHPGGPVRVSSGAAGSTAPFDTDEYSCGALIGGPVGLAVETGARALGVACETEDGRGVIGLRDPFGVVVALTDRDIGTVARLMSFGEPSR
jgi:hypothetical protein